MRFKKPKPLAGETRARVVGGSPRVVPGFREFWQPAYDRFSTFYKAADDLVPLVNEVLKRPLKGRLQIVLGFIRGIVSNSFRALTTLSMSGFGHNALRNSRAI